eukprot:5892940-Pleurochrysis_carterae.AAC.1
MERAKGAAPRASATHFRATRGCRKRGPLAWRRRTWLARKGTANSSESPSQELQRAIGHRCEPCGASRTKARTAASTKAH